MEYTRRYLMDGLHNLRDLGGYAVPGGITRFGVLLRSDLPWHLTESVLPRWRSAIRSICVMWTRVSPCRTSSRCSAAWPTGRSR